MFRFLRKSNKTIHNTEKVNDLSRNEGEKISCADEEMTQIPLVEITPRDMMQSLRGSKKRFSERIEYNLSSLSQRLPTPELVCERFSVGSVSKRKTVIVYLENVANPGIVKEIKDRIKSIETRTVLDTSYIERNIENSNFSPFPQLETTQRLDIAESALMQGRILIMLDGSPDVLLAPTTFFDLMDTPDDAYIRWPVAASFFRIARYIMLIIAASLPGFYIALTSFNPEVITTRLLLLILGAREETPFPVYFEAFLMMGVAESVRMMMIRIPSQIGATIALFSGITLVIAGLFANIIGSPVLMVVTLTIISSFGIPNFDLRTSIRIIQFSTMIMSSFFGLFGYAVSFFYITIHLATLKSFGIPFMTPLAPIEGSGFGHIVFRSNTVDMPQDETYKPLRPKNQS